jgi:farnesyl-diphosphate farnesyltransferase
MMLLLSAMALLSMQSVRRLLEDVFAEIAAVVVVSPVYFALIMLVVLQVAMLVVKSVRKCRAHNRTALTGVRRSKADMDAEQIRLMEGDMCIVVDDDDNVIGRDTKKNCHLLAGGLKLHRAFSIFIFDDQGRLLLQKRSADKITFPLCWANTCCSHPLHNEDGEIEQDMDPSSQSFGLGAKRAARRKIMQELGITPDQVPLSCITFMTRLHYRADLDETWGEHEIDYLLVCRPPAGTVRVVNNPNEVDQSRWFTQDELRKFCHDHAKDNDIATQRGGDAVGLERISPWFAAIERNGDLLHKWWDAVMLAKTPVVTDTALTRAREPAKIHREGTLFYYKAPRTALGSKAGSAGKLGGQGKGCPVHKHPIMDTLVRPRELWAALKYKFGGKLKKKAGCQGRVINLMDKKQNAALARDLNFCEHTLNKVSRSFAAVIAGLHEELRAPVAVFYLVLRALDTIEDETDLTRFKVDVANYPDDPRAAERYVKADVTGFDRQVALLRTFYKRLPVAQHDCDVDGSSWDSHNICGIGEADERTLLERLGSVLRVFAALPQGHREVIADITRKMADGMVEFAGRDLAAGSENCAEYDHYCHFVAGLVGLGLTRQFVASGLEDGNDARLDLTNTDAEGGQTLANSMGLFLQKANIIRDYLEDLLEGRSFWPKDIWSVYSPDGLDRLAEDPVKALHCLNHMVTNALVHGTDSLKYLEALKEPTVFRFCAIPQVMAIATMAEVYAEPRLFTGVLKIRKSLAALIMQECASMDDVRHWFAYFASIIISKVDPSDPNAEKTVRLARALGGTKIDASSTAEAQALGVVRSFLSWMKCWCGLSGGGKSKLA